MKWTHMELTGLASMYFTKKYRGDTEKMQKIGIEGFVSKIYTSIGVLPLYILLRSREITTLYSTH